MTRPRRKLTLVHKTNVLTYAGDLWQRTVDALAKEFADVSVDYCHVDAASMFFVSAPERFDVIVTDNLFGDILTDLGAAVAGGIGLSQPATSFVVPSCRLWKSQRGDGWVQNPVFGNSAEARAFG